MSRLQAKKPLDKRVSLWQQVVRATNDWRDCNSQPAMGLNLNVSLLES